MKISSQKEYYWYTKEYYCYIKEIKKHAHKFFLKIHLTLGGDGNATAQPS